MLLQMDFPKKRGEPFSCIQFQTKSRGALKCLALENHMIHGCCPVLESKIRSGKCYICIYRHLFHVPEGLFSEIFDKIEWHEIKQNTRSSTCLKIKIQEVKYLMIKLLILLLGSCPGCVLLEFVTSLFLIIVLNCAND